MTSPNLRELMGRMGHAGTRTAMIYLHGSAEHDRRIADALGALAQAEIERLLKGNDNGVEHPPLVGAPV